MWSLQERPLSCCQSLSATSSILLTFAWGPTESNQSKFRRQRCCIKGPMILLVLETQCRFKLCMAEAAAAKMYKEHLDFGKIFGTF